MNTDSASHDAQTGGTNVPPDARPSGTTEGKNIGHGHVFPRPDGVRTRCGGPAMCPACARDLARKNIEAGSPGGARAALNELHQMDQDMLGTSPGEPGGQPPQFYRLQDVYDRFHFVDYDARMWELIVVPQPLTKAG